MDLINLEEKMHKLCQVKVELGSEEDTKLFVKEEIIHQVKVESVDIEDDTIDQRVNNSENGLPDLVSGLVKMAPRSYARLLPVDPFVRNSEVDAEDLGEIYRLWLNSLPIDATVEDEQSNEFLQFLARFENQNNGPKQRPREVPSSSTKRDAYEVKYECLDWNYQHKYLEYLASFQQSAEKPKQPAADSAPKLPKPRKTSVEDIAAVDASNCKFKCSYCQKTFELPIQLQKHMKSHPEYHSFQCEVCGDQLHTEQLLYFHRKEHLKDESEIKKSRHVCRFCYKSFTRFRNVVLHERTHTGEKPHQCHTCGKFFRSIMALSGHTKAHTGDFKYACSFCNKKFLAPSSVVIHERIHTGERPYKCTHCPKSYSQKVGLVAHLRHHNGDLPYKCLFCDRRYAMGSFLNSHVRRVHKK